MINSLVYNRSHNDETNLVYQSRTFYQTTQPDWKEGMLSDPSLYDTQTLGICTLWMSYVYGLAIRYLYTIGHLIHRQGIEPRTTGWNCKCSANILTWIDTRLKKNHSDNLLVIVQSVLPVVTDCSMGSAFAVEGKGPGFYPHPEFFHWHRNIFICIISLPNIMIIEWP